MFYEVLHNEAQIEVIGDFEDLKKIIEILKQAIEPRNEIQSDWEQIRHLFEWLGSHQIHLRTYVKTTENHRIIDLLLDTALSHNAVDCVVKMDEEQVIKKLNSNSLVMKTTERIEICAHRWMPYRYIQDQRGLVMVGPLR